MSKFKLGEIVKIIAGPRRGEVGKVDSVFSNGVAVKTTDDWRHVIQDIHIEKVEIEKQDIKI